MPTKPQCPDYCVSDLLCRRNTLARFLSQMFGAYRDEIAPHKGRVVFVGDKPGVEHSRRLVYELYEFSPDALARCAEHLITTADQGTDVYFQPMLIRSGWPYPIPGRKERRVKKNVAYVDVHRSIGIFLDVDVHKRPADSRYRTDEEAEQAAREALESRGIRVDAVIRSGSGVHFHIRLEDDGRLRPEDVKEYSHRCMELLRAVDIPIDPQSSNAVLVARLPGTINHKADSKSRVVTVSHSAYALPQSTAPFEALPPAPRPQNKFKLKSPMDDLFDPNDLTDDGLTRFRDRLTASERFHFEVLGEANRNSVPARDKDRKAWLPFKKEQTHRLPRYGAKSGPPQSHSEFDFNGIKVVASLLDSRVKQDAGRLLEIAKILAAEHYDLRVGRAAPSRVADPGYWTVTALNAAYAGSPKFRAAVWDAYYKKRLASRSPDGKLKLPRVIPHDVLLDTFLKSRHSLNAWMRRCNRFMSGNRYVRQRRKGRNPRVLFINRDARDADRAKRRRQSPTPASVELSLRQLARQLRKLAAGNAPHHRAIGHATLTGKEMQELSRQFPHWQSARAALAWQIEHSPGRDALRHYLAHR